MEGLSEGLHEQNKICLDYTNTEMLTLVAAWQPTSKAALTHVLRQLSCTTVLHSAVSTLCIAQVQRPFAASKYPQPFITSVPCHNAYFTFVQLWAAFITWGGGCRCWTAVGPLWKMHSCGYKDDPLVHTVYIAIVQYMNTKM